jgi:biopolymer transport protein ExbD
MPLKTGPLEEPGLNLTSMLDVVMLLIIFFMVGAQFTEDERQYDIAVPSVAAASPLTSQPDEIVVNVNRDGQVSVKTVVLTTAQLETQLTAAIQNFPGQAVVIRGAADGPYQHVMDVLSLCRRVGVRNVSLAHRPKDE